MKPLPFSELIPWTRFSDAMYEVKSSKIAVPQPRIMSPVIRALRSKRQKNGTNDQGFPCQEDEDPLCSTHLFQKARNRGKVGRKNRVASTRHNLKCCQALNQLDGSPLPLDALVHWIHAMSRPHLVVHGLNQMSIEA